MIELVCGLVCRGSGTPGRCRRRRVGIHETQLLDTVPMYKAKEFNQYPVLEQVAAIPTIGRHIRIHPWTRCLTTGAEPRGPATRYQGQEPRRLQRLLGSSLFQFHDAAMAR